MKATLKHLLKITKGCSEDMHKPVEQDVSAYVSGTKLDNAFGDEPNNGEIVITLLRGEQRAYFNLATLIALARKAQL